MGASHPVFTLPEWGLADLMRRVVMFLNPLLVHTAKRRAAVEQIAELLSGRGADVHLQETLSAYSAGQQARDAVQAGFDTFLVCGGDGTVFQVLQGIAGADVTLGVLPFGTGNVIVQNQHVPRDPVKAAELLLEAEPRSVSLGKVTVSPVGHRKKQSWYFFIAAGMGVHAALMNLAPTGHGKRKGGRLAYYVGGVQTLLEKPVQVFEMEWVAADGTKGKETVSEVIAAHVQEINRWKAGGDPFGDALHLAWVPATGKVGLAHASFHALTSDKANGRRKGWWELPYAQYKSVQKVTCRPLESEHYESPLLVEADGEVLGAEQAVIGMAETRLKLLWPNGSRQE